MTEQEYHKKLTEIDKRAYDEKKELTAEFAMSNNPYAVGDILQDHYHIIKVESIRVVGNCYVKPQCAYKGTQLTKKLEPAKRQDDTDMYQSNVVRKIEKP